MLDDGKQYEELYAHIKLRQLFFLQERLDQKILARVEWEAGEVPDVQFKKVMALRVELAELINELRVQKYWSSKLPSAKEVILEEWADGFHFVLSIGIDKGVTNYQYKGIFDESITAEHLLDLLDDLMTAPWLTMRPTTYVVYLEKYIRLGFLLLFRWSEMNEAYVTKNMINHERQDQGY